MNLLTLSPNRGALKVTDSPRDRRRWNLGVTVGMTPERLAAIFLAADAGDLGQQNDLLQELLKDELIGVFMETRTGALSQRKLVVKPNPDDPFPTRAKEVAEFQRKTLFGLRYYVPRGVEGYLSDEGGVDECTEALCASAYYGLELFWGHWETKWGMPRPNLSGLELLDQRRYRLRPEYSEVRLETEQHGYFGAPLHEFDPWHLYPIVGRSLSPRLEFAGAGRATAFAWHLRQQGKLYSMAYSERFAVPAVVGYFESDSPDAIRAAYSDTAQAKLQRFVQSFMSDAAGIFPPGFKVEIVAAQQGGEKQFEFIERSTRSAIAIALKGEDGTSSGEGGSLAKTGILELQNRKLTTKDGKRVASFYQRIGGYAVENEFGVGTPAALVEFEKSAEEKKAEEEDKVRLAKELGVPVPKRHVYAVLGIPEPELGEEVVTFSGGGTLGVYAPPAAKPALPQAGAPLPGGLPGIGPGQTNGPGTPGAAPPPAPGVPGIPDRGAKPAAPQLPQMRVRFRRALPAWSVDGEPPTEFLLLHFGPNKSRHTGQEVEESWLLPELAQQIVTDYKNSGIQASADWEHAALKPEQRSTGHGAPASAWYDLEVRDDGLWAVNVEWTKNAYQQLENKEQRYISPTYYERYNEAEDRWEVLEWINFALTNTPASLNIRPLV